MADEDQELSRGVQQAIEEARHAQRAWAQRTVADRCSAVLQFRDALIKRSEEVVEVLVTECGKPRFEALVHELGTVIDLMTYHAHHAPEILASHPLDLHLLKHRRSYVRYVPWGVVGIISPWNYPLTIPLRDVTTALLAGNAVVLKPSEYTPRIASKAKEIFDASGLPPALFQVVSSERNVGPVLIESGIDKLVFTGSVEVGKRVGAACGERLIPCTLELGGKGAAIVCEDADLEKTSEQITWGGFANSGQICISVERVYVHQAVYDAFTKKLVAKVRSLRAGDPARKDTDVGRLTVQQQANRAEHLIADALKKGAVLLQGGKHEQGILMPTVLASCSADMEVMTHEIFGPVLPVMQVKDENEAVEQTNASRYGLINYVFTKNKAKGRRIAESIRSGTVMINGTLLAYGAPEAPFGGVGHSGFGRVNGMEGLRGMCSIQHVNEDRKAFFGFNPIGFPHTSRKYDLFARLIQTYRHF